MKKTFLISGVILLVVFIFLLFIPKDNRLSNFYEKKINEAFVTIPILSSNQKCLVEEYTKETYWTPPIGATRPYDGAYKDCGFISTGRSIDTMKLYNETLVRNGWKNRINGRLNGDVTENSCVSDTYSKNTADVIMTNCPSNHGLELGDNNTKNEIGLRVMYRATDEEIAQNNKTATLLFIIKSSVLILSLLSLLIGFILACRKK